jgi:very-short-patch-repair endonuclease
MNKLHNLPHMKERRRALRRDMTVAERALWQLIRSEQLGVKFRRQQSVGRFVLDFYCPALSLAIEVDGSSHNEEGAALNDELRQCTIEATGIHFVRVTDPQVLHDPTYVLQCIRTKILELRNNPNAGKYHSRK